MKLLTQLQEMQNFTQTEETIASFILSNKEAIAHLSIQELAKQTFSSHSAVIRLSRKLGLSGFKEFKIKLVQELQQDLEDVSNVDPNIPFQYNESPIQIGKDIAELMKETIDRCYGELDNETLNQGAHLLHQAKRIFIYALGDSQIRATSFQNKLFKLNKYAIITTELSEWAYHTANMDKNDCAIFLTYHGQFEHYLKAAQYFKEKAIPFITITAMTQSRLSRLSTVCIGVPDDEVKHAKIGTFSSQIAFEYVLNVLYSCIYKIDYTENKEALARSIQTLKTKDMLDH
ncbi:sugar isomerase (sis) [Trichococcus palustris]|uniref:Sugar isomerase (Sis) n=1 Tax=Trichococcus palustris TaxID=140314 RepID=A0A143YPL6_9LACT|nr:MurR/RpiR family transcriptional regulator [Trichococcus palustris]CZQ92480.1 sugar isomerase (sis) [Trichococcus palustris]SFL05312.1 transcriptional regulator, RpiR family [Trichococcus palustris]